MYRPKTGAERALLSNSQAAAAAAVDAAFDRQTSQVLAGAFGNYDVDLRTGGSLLRDVRCAENIELEFY